MIRGKAASCLYMCLACLLKGAAEKKRWETERRTKMILGQLSL